MEDMCYEIMIRLGDPEACVDWTSRTNLNCVNDLLCCQLEFITLPIYYYKTVREWEGGQDHECLLMLQLRVGRSQRGLLILPSGPCHSSLVKSVRVPGEAGV